MGAPTITARAEPAGYQLPNGYQALVTFAAAPALALFEREVTPPGWEGGDKIDNSNQHGVKYKIFRPRSLIESTDGSFTAGYDPLAFVDIDDLVNVEESITWHFPDGSAVAYWGYLKSFVPNGMSDGVLPEATTTIVITNWDPYLCVEAGPVYQAGDGSCVGGALLGPSS